MGLAEAGEGATGRLDDGDVLGAAGVTEAAGGSADGATGLLSPPSPLGDVEQVEPKHGTTASEATPCCCSCCAPCTRLHGCGHGNARDGRKTHKGNW